VLASVTTWQLSLKADMSIGAMSLSDIISPFQGLKKAQ
jgi:hypothetical protein